MFRDWKEHLFRFAMGLLLSFGLMITLLSGLGLPPRAGILGLAVLLLAVLEFASLNRRTVLIGSLLGGTVFLVWSFAAGGADRLQNLLRAFSLHLSGISFALPLVANDFSVFLAGVLTVLSFFCSRRSAGGVPASLLSVTALLLIWLSDRFSLVWSLTPAMIAAIMLLIRDAHEEISPLRVLPWIAGLVLLAAAVTPASGVVSAPLKSRADQLRQFIIDRLFYTEPRDVFSLLNEGFYPEGRGQLGGKPNPSDHPVMQVSAPRAVYLRGVALNEYDGRCWKNTLGGRRYLWDSPSSLQNRLHLFDQGVPAEGLYTSIISPVNVSVRMLSDSASTLFVPQRIRELRVGGGLVPYFSNSSELFVTRNLQPGDTWSVSAPLFLGGDSGLSVLVDAAASAEDPFWDAVAETYTSLPSHLEEPVWQMARDVTEPYSSAYEKAFALRNFLTRSYRYSLDVEDQPFNLDFVTNFLFNTGEGYCTYFASAMTVLCRMAGLPARYVEGYLAQPDTRGEAVVTGLNAHAWTEVYFRGFGWVTFDATPRSASSGESEGNERSADAGENSPAPSPEPEANTPSPTPSGGETETPRPTPEPSPEEEISPDPSATDHSADPEQRPEAGLETAPAKRVSGLLWGILLILLLVLLLLFRWIRTSPASREKRASDPGAVFDVWLNETQARLSARGFRRGPGETPMSYTRRLDASENLPISLSPLGECVSLLRYSRAVPQENDLRLVRETAAGLKKEQTPANRLRYILIRMLPGRRKAGGSAKAQL